MEPLLSLVYVSSAVKALTVEEIEHLLKRARARNFEHDITGVLLHCDGNFMQYLEGAPDDLAFVYDIIKSDPQHRALIEIIREPIAQREFADWSMAYRSVEANGYETPLHIEPPVNLESGPADTSMARLLLNGFWTRASRLHTSL